MQTHSAKFVHCDSGLINVFVIAFEKQDLTKHELNMKTGGKKKVLVADQDFYNPENTHID